MNFRSKQDKVYKGLISGCIGGLASSWIMTRFQVLLAHALGHSDPHEGQGEDATVKTAEKISSGLLDHELSTEEKKKAGPIVHYLVALMGQQRGFWVMRSPYPRSG